MAITQFKGNSVRTIGDIPQVGAKAPNFTLVGTDLSEITQNDYSGQWISKCRFSL